MDKHGSLLNRRPQNANQTKNDSSQLELLFKLRHEAHPTLEQTYCHVVMLANSEGHNCVVVEGNCESLQQHRKEILVRLLF